MSCPPPLPTRRADLLARLAWPRQFDLAVVGGGATGLGVALDAAARGFSVVLVESHDFAHGTSSRSTKLVHGGVRYLAQGHLPLVREALHERATLLRMAPHLVHPLEFVLPCYRWWEKPFYALGLKAYDALAGRAAGLPGSRGLNRAQTLASLPGVAAAGLRGGVAYWDGQFDDARLALALARTAAREGALLVNYCAAVALRHDRGRVAGLVCEDRETGQRFPLQARCVVNATGVWVDALRQLDQPSGAAPSAALVTPSQGVHLVVDGDFLPGGRALLVPRTADGRVLFAIPWLGKVLLGTTDTPRSDAPREPLATAGEVDFILREAGRCLRRPPQRADVRSIWVGLRPLVRPGGDASGSTPTQGIGREHTVRSGPGGLVTVAGGKWTTFRAMAEDVLAHCVQAGLLDRRSGGVTADLRLVGAPPVALPMPAPSPHGDEQDGLAALPGAALVLAPELTEAQVRFAARHEYARTVEDVLARRSRLLFLDAATAGAAAPAVAAILAEETGSDPALAAFAALAQQYQQLPTTE